MATFQPTDRVLVTGANGYLGAAIVQELLSRKITVRAAVRSSRAQESIERSFPDEISNNSLEIVIVPDITKKGAFETALRDVDYIIHTASPLPTQWKGDGDRDLIQPAILGFTSILETARDFPQIRKVVITSSIAASWDHTANYTKKSETDKWGENTWNPVTYEEALEFDKKLIESDGKDRIARLEVYGASKKLSEKKAWDWYKESKPPFGLTMVNPAFVYGASAIKDAPLDGSNAAIWDMIKPRPLNVRSVGVHGIVDIRDVAHVHVVALITRETDGRRLFACHSHPTTFQVATIAHNVDPDTVPAIQEKSDPQEDKQKSWTTFDSTPTESLLGIKFRPLDQSIKDFVEYVKLNKLC